MHILQQLASQHLQVRLRPINRALRELVHSQAQAAASLERPEVNPLAITKQHVDTLLKHCESLSLVKSKPMACLALNPEEQKAEQMIKDRARQESLSLPLDDLQAKAGLAHYEVSALVTCAATEIDAAYERIFGFIHDDMNRRYTSVELLSKMHSLRPLELRACLGPFGRLRSLKLLESFGELSTYARTQLRLGPGVLDFVTGAGLLTADLWREPNLVPPLAIDTPQSDSWRGIGEAVKANKIQVVGLWGHDAAEREDAACCIAATSGRPLQAVRELNVHEAVHELRNLMLLAGNRNALMSFDVSEIAANFPASVLSGIARQLAACSVPILLQGNYPWRPTELLAERPYVEITLSAASQEKRKNLWLQSLPKVDEPIADRLATHFRLSSREISAVGNVVRSNEIIHEARPDSIEARIGAACLTVVAKRTGRLLTTIPCRRGPEDLILPPELHRQVLEIATFSDVLPLVADQWGFGRLATGNLGIKCLFTGDPGTGKTLAAEVIAGQMGVPLLRLNLAEVVSKWIGETEKNIDAAFQEAAVGRGLLLVDEADTLFGKRGEIKQGMDRFANLEVGYLLQRLEDHPGPVVLASNLKGNIDPGFMRRFQTVLHFPRPAAAERLRLWQMAFPAAAPLERDFDKTRFAALDMTGAGILGAARTSALLAAAEGAPRIGVAHIVRAIARQFRQEGRVLTPRDLGEHANLLVEQA